MSGFERSPAYRAAQEKRSRRSPYRKPGSRDFGQRYVVSYVDGTGQRRNFGFTDDLVEARKWAVKIKKNPMWGAARIQERRP